MRYSTCSPSSSSSVTHAPKNTRRPVFRRLIDDSHAVQSLTQKAHAPVDLAQLTFAVDVFGVFRTVALGGGFGDCLRDLRAQDAPQVIQFLPETGCPFRGNEPGTSRSGRAVTTHVILFANLP